MATPISWQRKIHSKVVGAVLIAFTISYVAVGLFTYFDTSRSKTAELNQLAEATAIAIARHLVNPMWDVDTELVGSLLEAEMSESRISAIVVHDEDLQTLFAARHRSDDGVIVESANDLAESEFTVTRKVVNENKKPIGSVSVSVSPDTLKAELGQLGRTVFMILVGINVLLYLVLTIVLNFVVLKPLREVEKSAEKMSEGELSTPITVNTQDEIGSLATTLESVRIGFNRAIKRVRSISQKGIH